MKSIGYQRSFNLRHASLVFLLFFCLHIGYLFASKDDSGSTNVAIIGTSTTSTSNTTPSPINAYYKSLHDQAIYKASELSAAGITTPMRITQLGFYIQTAPSVALPNFQIRMKHTTDSMVTQWQSKSLLQTVYQASSYQPVAGGFHMLSLSTPFIWNGVDNIVVDTSFDRLPSTSSTGTIRYSSATNGYRYIRSDHADQAEVFTGGFINSNRPNMRFVFSALSPAPDLQVFPSSIDFGRVLSDAVASTEFIIFNGGAQILMGDFSHPAWLRVMPYGSDEEQTQYSLDPGQHRVYSCQFSSTQIGNYTGTFAISQNSFAGVKQISTLAQVYNPTTVPFVDGYEGEVQNWVFANEGNTNKWYNGAATANSGNSSIYISNNLGVNHAYTIGSSSKVHVYSDIYLPDASQTHYLRFSWQGLGAGTSIKYHYLQVYLAEVSYLPVAGFMPSGGLLLGQYNGSALWTTANIALPEYLNGSQKRLIFTWVNDAGSGTQPPAAIDYIRIVLGANSEGVLVMDGAANIEAPVVVNEQDQEIHSTANISDIAQGEGLFVSSYYDSGTTDFSTSGLELIFSGLSFAGSLVEIYHGLGFTPSQLAWRIAYGSWNFLASGHPDALEWDAEKVKFRVPTRAEGDLEVIFAAGEDGTLPVELSSFSAIYRASVGVNLAWKTASETGLAGYQILRSETNNLHSAQLISGVIPAQNSSQGAEYAFLDDVAASNTSYYYWLQVSDFGGGLDSFGPVLVITNPDIVNELPVIPLKTDLINNFPNPFNPHTTLRYSLKAPGTVQISIFNQKGQQVRSYRPIHSDAGYYCLAFDGKDAAGQYLGSGVYYAKMQIGGQLFTRKMVLLK